MSDSAEFEKLTMLEARLAAALDRIASGLATGATGQARIDDPGLTSAALEDAQARADTAENTAAQWAERAGMLEAELAEAQAALTAARAGDDAPDTSEVDGLRTEADGLRTERDALEQRVDALEAARQADRDEANRTIAARDEEIASLKSRLSDAMAQASSGSEEDDEDRGDAALSSEDLHVLQMRIKRLKRQRAMARSERDRVLGKLDELDRGPEDIDARIVQLRHELADLRVSHADLTEQLAAMNDQTVEDKTLATIVEGLVTELQALQDIRAAEAGELDRILAELGPLDAEDKAHA